MLLLKDIDIQIPSARGASTLYKVRFTDIKTGQKIEERFKGDDNLETIHLTHQAVSSSYVKADEYIFIDNENFTPYSFNKTDIQEELLFFTASVTPGLQVLVMNN